MTFYYIVQSAFVQPTVGKLLMPPMIYIVIHWRASLNVLPTTGAIYVACIHIQK